MSKKLLLIDGNSLTYRAFYGSAYGPRGILINSDGIPVNAVLTLNSMLNKVFKEYLPTHVLVAFDAGKKTVRHKKLESYKGGRKKTPIELIRQFPIVKEMLDAWGIKRYELSQIEADDIIGSSVETFKNEIDIAVLSSDRDLYQLVQKNVDLIVPQNGAKNNKIVEIDLFYDEFGYNPWQVIDMKGLTGDSSDNLPGVAGIGDKGAIKLLSKYGNLENIYKNIADQTPKLKEKLEISKDIAFLCKELATLINDLKLPFQLEELEFKNNISNSLISFFKKYELKSLVKKFSFTTKEEKNKESFQLSFDKILF